MNFYKKRITSENIKEYMKINYPELLIKNSFTRRISHIPILLQNNYGGDNDCTLTCLTAILLRLKPTYTDKEIYQKVEKIAKQYGYTGKNGTNPFLIKSIFETILKHFSIDNKSKVKYIKNIGYSFNFIKEKVNMNTPLILSMGTDGRDFYKNHSVLIVGYREYELVNASLKKVKRFLIVQDNWVKHISFIDYDKLSFISSINYYE